MALDTWFGDLRFAWRSFLRVPAVAALAVLILGLGIGTTSTIFSAAYGVLIRPLPYHQPDHLFTVWSTRLMVGADTIEASAPDWLEWREQNRVFKELAAYRGGNFNLLIGNSPERVGGARVSHNFFRTLGIQPALGRDFEPEKAGQPRGPQVALLSHNAWQRRFASDPSIVGRTLTVDGTICTIVGVLPEDFRFLPLWRAEVLVPLVFDEEERVDRDYHWLYVIGRIAPGVSIEQATAEMNAIAGRLEKLYPKTNTGFGVRLAPLREEIVGPIKPAIVLLSVAVGLVLLLACANVAILLIARATAREKEIALRLSLGGARKRLIRQLLTEGLLLALLGGTVGVLIALVGIRFLVSLIPVDLALVVVPFFGISMSIPVLVFTLLISVLTVLIFGLWPAFQATKPNLTQALKESGVRARRGSGYLSGRAVLITSELVLTLVLLTAAGLLIRGFLALQKMDPGFNPEGVLTAEIDLPETFYAEPHQKVAGLQRILESIKAVPNVESVGAVSILPMSPRNQGTGLVIEGQPPSAPGDEPGARYLTATPGYFQTMQIELVRGQVFTDQHRADTAPVIIINRALADRFWPDGDPIGKHVTVTRLDERPRQIIGVVEDVRYGVGRAAGPTVYLPYAQDIRSDMNLTLRTGGRPEAQTSALRTAVQQVDRELPMTIRTMDQVIAETMAQARFPVPPLAVFAAIALVLAAAGIYAVTAYFVNQRSREIGIRIALGARRRDIFRLVLGQAVKLAAAGLVIGLLGALALGRVLAGFLYGVPAMDPVTFCIVPVLMAALVLAASYLPARHATRIDPSSALRRE